MSRFPVFPLLASLLLVGLPLRAAPSDAVSAAAETHRKAVDAARESWRAEAVEILTAERDRAADELADAKVAGNMTRQARALAMRQLCDKALQGIEADGEPSFPETIRREIRPAAEAIRTRLDALATQRDAAIETAGRTFRAAVRATLEAQGLPATDADIDRAIAAAQAAPAAQSPSPATDATPAESGATPPPEGPKPLGESGPATSWAPLVGIAVQVADIDIVRIPVTAVRQRRTLTLPGGLAPISAAITPTENVFTAPASGAIAFRALSVPGFPSPEILEWPTARNDWSILLRCRPDAGPDTPVAVKIEIAAGAPGLRSLAGGDVASAKADRILMSLDSRPSGAIILLDGAPVPGPDGKPLKTPAEVPMPPEGAALTLRLDGFMERSFPNVVPKAGQPVTVPLSRDPDYIDRIIEVRPNSANGLSAVVLKQGLRYRVAVDGTWSCDKGKTMVDCEGYSVDKFPAVYLDPAANPRLTTDENYGALLFAIGKDGRWRHLPRAATITADATGPLRLDINEGGVARNRMDNTGALKVRIRSLPR